MKEEFLDKQIAESIQRFEQLWIKANQLPITARATGQESDDKPILKEEMLLWQSLEELTNSLHELQVVSEELRQQNEELTLSRLAVDAERQRYQELFDLAPDAYLVTNLEGAIQEANIAAEKLLNVGRDRLLGKPLIVFIPELNRRNFRTQLNQLQSGKEVRNWELQIQPRNPLGNSLLETACTVVPILNSKKQVVGLRWLLRDISDRKQAEQLEQKLTMLDQILRASPAQIFLCDRKGKFLYASPKAARQLGLEPTDIVGKTWQALGFSRQVVELFVAQIEAVITIKHPITAEFSLPVADEVKIFEYTLSPIDDATNIVEAVVVTVQDITKHKQAEAKINKALKKEKEINDLKTRFVSIVSHEFRNPLHRIFMSADLLKTYAARLTDEQKNQQLHYIVSSAKQTKQILDDMLLVFHGETGRLKCQPGLLDLQEFCRQIVKQMEIVADGKVAIAFSTQGHTSACLDEKLLRSILTNLLSNAIKYSPVGSQIQFDLICDSSTAVFQIQDSGIGIPAKDQEQLFISFHRGSNTDKIEGIGLGLSIVKQCVDIQGGKIDIESEEGVGTKVTVTLPLRYSVNS